MQCLDIDKSLAIVITEQNYTKQPFGPNWCFGQSYHSRIEVLQIAQLLALVILTQFLS